MLFVISGLLFRHSAPGRSGKGSLRGQLSKINIDDAIGHEYEPLLARPLRIEHENVFDQAARRTGKS
ncbi:MAG: hypothetical protein JXO51_12185, partial [Candidatus Aminicenantes bacterium]|nr:hypothetical protein [Candidatus Aminicenantes bacterium]